MDLASSGEIGGGHSETGSASARLRKPRLPEVVSASGTVLETGISIVDSSAALKVNGLSPHREKT